MFTSLPFESNSDRCSISFERKRVSLALFSCNWERVPVRSNLGPFLLFIPTIEMVPGTWYSAYIAHGKAFVSRQLFVHPCNERRGCVD